MSERKLIWRGAARAGAGLVVAVAAVAAVAALSVFTLPTVEKQPPVVAVDTTQNSMLRLVCAGSFSVLGADVSRADVAVPVGEPDVTIAGDPAEKGELGREEKGGELPVTLTAPADQLLAAAQSQSVSAEAGVGLAASACASPMNDQWLLGGSTMLGVATTLSLGNPGEVPATAQITVYDENGRVADRESAAVRVSPGREVTVSVNGYAPDRERIAVHVSSSGAPVTASLGVTHVIGLEPLAVSSVTRQAEPETRLVVPGVTNIEDHGDHPTHDDGDDVKVVVRVLAPGSKSGAADVWAVNGAGARTELGSIDLVGDAVGELEVLEWPNGANAVVIESDVPIIGGVRGSALSEKKYDYGWFAPAPELRPGAPAAAAIVAGGELVLANPGTAAAEAEISELNGNDVGDNPDAPHIETVPPGAAVVVKAPRHAVISSDQVLHAGVRALGEGRIDGYPILSESQREGALQVYVR